MRVVFLSETYPRRMGYLVTMLPRAMARLGADVHLLALDLPPYHYLAKVKDSYQSFFAGQIPEAGTVEMVDGYTVHILPHRHTLGYARMAGLAGKIRELEPDVVYSSVAIGWLPLQAFLCRLRQRFALFTGSHTAESMFPLAGRARPWRSWEGLRCLAQRWLPGRIVSLVTQLCYVPTADCGEIAWRFFGVQRRKLRVRHLGVDLEVFRPATDADHAIRRDIRSRLGCGDDDVLCVYSGKLAAYKKPLLLAEAVALLREGGRPFRALFIGEGEEREALARSTWCHVLDSMPYWELGDFYRAADIAVWPFGESTSMLDAAACGIPIVVSDRIYRDHVDGNGRTYDTGNLMNLVAVLAELENPALRAALGRTGAEKMARQFDWREIARQRLEDFRAAVDR